MGFFDFLSKGKTKKKVSQPKLGYYIISYTFNGYSSTYPTYAYSKQEAIGNLKAEYPDATDISTSTKSKQT